MKWSEGAHTSVEDWREIERLEAIEEAAKAWKAARDGHCSVCKTSKLIMESQHSYVRNCCTCIEDSRCIHCFDTVGALDSILEGRGPA